ncbi:MAG: nucleotide exchange factor GrpE [Actinomycetia bacterium]|nr:nucleotide exchange factor GrpE [Actinomycetes bacterium]
MTQNEPENTGPENPATEGSGPQNAGPQPGAPDSVGGDLFDEIIADLPTDPDLGDLSVDDAITPLEQVTVERDQYLDGLQRSQAEFANFRKAVTKRESDARARAAESLVAELLPVLDACDAALAQGVVDVEPVHKSLLDVLERAGLTRVDPTPGDLFDPNAHEAVMTEPGDGGEPTVAEVLRAGFAFKLRVLRPAMVKVRS